VRARERDAAAIALAVALGGCGAAPAPAARPASTGTVRSELAIALEHAQGSEPTARGRAAAIARVVFGERRLHEQMTCLELACLVARAGGTGVARTPHHAVIVVDGSGGPLFLDPADPGAVLDAAALARAHPWPSNAAAMRIYGRRLSTPEYQADEDANLAARELDAGRPAEALTLTDGALRVEPDLPEALVNRAAALLASGRTADAAPLLARADAVLPGDPAILYNRGVAAAADGRRDEAIRFYDEVLRVEPANERARANREALMR
jgi:tetratricopeptide (TPR) repeat protein